MRARQPCGPWGPLSPILCMFTLCHTRFMPAPPAGWDSSHTDARGRAPATHGRAPDICSENKSRSCELIAVLHMRELRLGEVKPLVRGHTARVGQSGVGSQDCGCQVRPWIAMPEGPSPPTSWPLPEARRPQRQGACPPFPKDLGSFVRSSSTYLRWALCWAVDRAASKAPSVPAWCSRSSGREWLVLWAGGTRRDGDSGMAMAARHPWTPQGGPRNAKELGGMWQKRPGRLPGGSSPALDLEGGRGLDGGGACGPPASATALWGEAAPGVRAWREPRPSLFPSESFTPDHKPLMGEAPELRGFFLGCGFNSAGGCRRRPLPPGPAASPGGRGGRRGHGRGEGPSEGAPHPRRGVPGWGGCCP